MPVVTKFFGVERRNVKFIPSWEKARRRNVAASRIARMHSVDRGVQVKSAGLRFSGHGQRVGGIPDG
jgi:hypothetical protein